MKLRPKAGSLRQRIGPSNPTSCVIQLHSLTVEKTIFFFTEVTGLFGVAETQFGQMLRMQSSS